MQAIRGPRRAAAAFAGILIGAVLLIGCVAAGSDDSTDDAGATSSSSATAPATSAPSAPGPSGDPDLGATVPPGDTIAPPTGAASPGPGTAAVPYLVVGAGGLTVVTDAGSVDYGYSDSAAPAIGALTALLGPPSTSYAPPAKCEQGSTSVSWPSIAVRYPGQDPASTAADFEAIARSAPVTGPAGAVVDVVTPHGARIGDPFAAYAPAVAGNERLTGGTFDVVVDTVRDDTRDTYGVVVTAQDGTITVIAAPTDLGADC